MNIRRFPPVSGPKWRWLALAGALTTLLIPFSARADHGDDGTMEVLASAAVAYAVIGAAGGFDDHRHDRHHYRDRHDRYRAWSRHDARYCRDHSHHHGRYIDRHGDHYKPHHDRYKYKHDNRRHWDGHHPGRSGDRSRFRAYH